MSQVRRILVVQTAFIGDVILTLPLIQRTKEFFTGSAIDVVVVPRAADVLRNHPSLANVIIYDKRGADRGLSGLWHLGRRLKQTGYDLALVPHRSLRSALLGVIAGIPLRLGFDRSAGRFLFTKTSRYDEDAHEIERNLSLLGTIGIEQGGRSLPKVYPGPEEKSAVDRLGGMKATDRMIAIAPGTVWNTKRWLPERFAGLAGRFLEDGFEVVLVGGPEDRDLCNEVQRTAGTGHMINAAGQLSLLESAELIRRCRLLVCNDSAPMHLAVAVGTPVVAVFGATVPEFGFAPRGTHDTVVEVRGLSCRPCSIHGGERCPIKTFDCMNNITVDRVYARAVEILNRLQA